jgi:WD40 repeat protein
MTLTLAGLVLAAAVGADGPTTTADLRLVVPSGRTGPADLFLVDPAAGNTKNVTRTDDAEEIFPAWSPDGKKLAFCCRSKEHLFEVYVCDADGSNRKRLTSPPAGTAGVCTSPTWSPDGKRIAYSRMPSGDRGELRVVTLDGADDERIAADGMLPSWGPDGKRIAFLQTGDGKANRLVTANADGTGVKVLVGSVGKTAVCMPAWSPDGRLIAYPAETLYGYQLCVVPAAGGPPRQLTQLLGMNLNPVWLGRDRVLFAHFPTANPAQPGGAYATIRTDGTRLQVHPLGRVEPPNPLIRPAVYVKPDPAAEANGVQQAGLTEPVAEKPPFTVMPEVIHPPFAPGGTPGLAWAPDGKRLAFGIDAGGVVLADFDGKSIRPTDALRGHEGPVEAVAFSPDGKRLYSTGPDKSLRVWDMTLKGTKAIETDHEAAATSLAVTPDGTLVMSAGLDGLIKVRAADTGKPLREFPLTARKTPVRALAVGKTGTLYAASGRWELPVSGGVVVAFDPEAGKELWRIVGASDAVGGVWALAVSPDGTKLAGACLDQCVRVWDAKTGRELGCWQGHADRVTGVCWSPDGRAVVSCGFDHTVRVWDAATGRPTHQLAAHASPAVRVAFSPTGTHFASTDAAGAIIVWRVSGE